MADKLHLFIPYPGYYPQWLPSPTNHFPQRLPNDTSTSLKLLGLQQLLIVFALGFTRKDSMLRAGLFAPMFMLCLLGLGIYREHQVTVSAILSIYLPLGAASQALQYISVVLIKRWNFEDRANLFPSMATSQKPSWLDRLIFGSFAAFSFRNCGTSYEVGGVAQFKDNKTPSRAGFLLRTVKEVAISWLIMDLVSYLGGTDENPAFAQSRVPLLSRLGEVTVAELFERAGNVCMLYASNMSLLIIGFGVASIISVGTGLSDPSRWKPAFGFGNGFPYSVRRFWSHLWHVSMKDRIYTPSKFIVDDVLGVPKGSLLRRYALIWFTFMVSGIFHVVAEVGAGVSFSEDGSFVFYMAQAAVIMAEDLVSYLWNRNAAEKRATPAWELWVGRVWTFCWMVWITPGWFYPMQRLTAGIPVLPFSPAKAFVSMVS